MYKISLITVVYNSCETIETTIKSVIGQNYNNKEYIIIDGGSTDGTVDIIKKYEKKLAYWCSEKDSGVSEAFNKGIIKANGEIIGLVNSGDFLEPSILLKVAKTFEEQKVDIVYGNVQYWKNGEKEYLYRANHRLLPRFMSINHPAVFVKKEAYEKYGLFDTQYNLAMDYELMLRFFLKGAKFYYLDETLSNMSLDGISDRYWRRAYKEVYLIKKLHLSRKKSLLFLEYGFQLMKRYLSNLLAYFGMEGLRSFYRAKFSSIKKSHVS